MQKKIPYWYFHSLHKMVYKLHTSLLYFILKKYSLFQITDQLGTIYNLERSIFLLSIGIMMATSWFS